MEMKRRDYKIYLVCAIAMVLAGFLTLIITPRVNSFLLTKGYTGKDVHKEQSPPIPEFGGIVPVIVTFVAVVLPFIFLELNHRFELIAALTTIFLTALIGLFDDIKGMKQRYKIVLCFIAALPLCFIVRDTTLGFSLFGTIDLGVLYYLFVVLTVATSANLVNLLAGFNGLETGLGIVSVAALAAMVVLSGQIGFLVLILPFLAALIGFFHYNWYPAKSFPGDTLTLAIGATLASLAILTKTEFYLALLLLPHFADFFLKTFVGFKGRVLYGNTTLNPDGTLTPAPYPALAHKLLQMTPMTEKQLVKTLIGLEAFFALLTVSLSVLHYK